LLTATRSLAFAISQPVFLTKIFGTLSRSRLTSNLSRSTIIAAGATHLDRLVSNLDALRVLKAAYSEATRDTMIVALVAICMGLLCIPGMEWLKLENTSVVQTGDDQVPRNIEEAKDSKP
jgi:hypothetical protein